MLFSVLGIAIVAVAACVILQKTNPEFSMAVALITGILIFLFVLSSFTPILKTLEYWMNEFHLNNVYFMTVIKTLGVCYLTQLASDTCKDAGYVSVASKVELAGKVTILLLALPLFENLLSLTQELIRLGGG